MKQSVFSSLAAAAQTGEKVALGIITGVKGSSPQKIGAKALFFPDGRIVGTLGGGCLEAEIQQRAIRSLQTDESSRFELLLDHDFGWDDGLICGGKVLGVILPNAQKAGEEFWNTLASRQKILTWGVTENFTLSLIDPSIHQSINPFDWLYRETVSPPCPLWIAGAGHIAQAVAPLALKLDFGVTVFDDRPALANHHHFPQQVELRSANWETLFAQNPCATPSFALIVTRGHRHDALVLKNWITLDFNFIGMIGSSRKARLIFQELLDQNIARAEQLERVACPVGIEIGSESVEEIAVSIMAQFIQKRFEFKQAHASSDYRHEFAAQNLS